MVDDESMITLRFSRYIAMVFLPFCWLAGSLPVCLSGVYE